MKMYVNWTNIVPVLLDKYYDGIAYMEKADKDTDMPPLSADWTLTKDGNRALLYPLLVIEKPGNYGDYGQNNIHNFPYLKFYIEKVN